MMEMRYCKDIKKTTQNISSRRGSMKVNALLMDEKDNVVTCVEKVSAGQEIIYNRGGELCSITAKEEIPFCHKAALEKIESGQVVRKYGEQIGEASETIEAGYWVSDKNIFSVPRNYENEYIKEV
jgi:hypothetical protein